MSRSREQFRLLTQECIAGMEDVMTKQVRLAINGHAAELTTEHPQSSHNQPVLLIDGVAYGYADRIPFETPSGTAYTVPSLIQDRSLSATDPVCRWNALVDRHDPLSGVDIP